MVGGEGIACVDASERAGLHTIFATGAASTTGRACDGLNCAMRHVLLRPLFPVLRRDHRYRIIIYPLLAVAAVATQDRQDGDQDDERPSGTDDYYKH